MSPSTRRITGENDQPNGQFEWWANALFWLANALQYTAREFDSETSPYYYRAGYYDLNAGMLLSQQDGPERKYEFDSTWLHLKLKGAATPSKHKTFGLGIQFDSHRPLHNSC